MIELKHVSFAYQGQEHDGLHDINLTIAHGSHMDDLEIQPAGGAGGAGH